MEHRNEFFGIEAGYFCNMGIEVDAYKEQVAKAAGVEFAPQVSNLMNNLEEAEDIIDTLPEEDAAKLRRIIMGVIGFNTIYSTIDAVDYKQYRKLVKAEAAEIRN